MKSDLSTLKKRAVTLAWLFVLVWAFVAVLWLAPSGGIPLLLIAILWSCLWILFR